MRQGWGGVGLERWLRWSAHPLVVLCAGIGHSTLLLLLEPQKWQLLRGLFVSYWTLIRAQQLKKKQTNCFQCRNCRRYRFNPWWGRSFGGEHATHFGVLAWRIPWTEEPGGLQSMGLQRVRHEWATKQQQTTFSILHLCHISNFVQFSPFLFFLTFSSWIMPPLLTLGRILSVP